MKSVLVLVCVVVVMAAVSAHSYSDLINEEWNLFKIEHEKMYDNQMVEAKRLTVYLENRRNVAKHNQLFAQGLVSYQIGLNEFSDMHHDEFLKIMNVNNSIDLTGCDGKKNCITPYIEPANTDFDDQDLNWVEEGVVTPVQNQKNCQCGWAFSAIGAIESQQFRHFGSLVSLSAQNLIDCSKGFGNKGCSGGTPINAFSYVMENGGIDTGRSYAYEAIDDKPCRYNPMTSGATVTGIRTISAGDEVLLKKAVGTEGPIAAMIDASVPTFKAYSHGIYDDPQCSFTKVNHGVLIVGYGKDFRHNEYWIVKNSWGTSWGDHGYIKIARNKKNTCGIATAASFPLV